ncbi:MAG: aldehyde dehydrogenase family protein [Propionibacteriales bacterium]|nr:aldehyde dehydrogenase family protein [Propionibacteriales bacterium]
MTAPLGSSTTGPADPAVDPTATYAVDPALARRLTSRLIATSGETAQTHAPFTGQPIATLPLSGPDDVVTAFERARAAQRRWASTPLEHRADALLRLHDLVLDRQDDILDLVQWESGKVRKHAFEEVAHVAMTCRYYARTAARHLAPARSLGLFPGLTRADVNRVPKGVVGIISPWNYPFTLALCDGLPALLAGNAVVHKPDSQTPLAALLGTELLEEAGFPADLWQPVYGAGSVVGTAIIDHADHVCFTGSTATGRLVAERAARRLIGCSLELGGKNPMLVLRDASVDRAAEGAVRACFSSAGQLCVSMERLYVADQIYDRFVERFLRRIEALRLSTALDFTGDMGSLVSQAQLDTVVRHVDDADAKGARVLTGGRPRPDVGPLFYEPTVLEGVTPDMTCFADETFGPVVSLYRFGDEADAVARANEGAYGLNASIYTRDGARGRALARRIRCGTVNVNEGYAAAFGSVDGPMGGMRESGLGRRQGAEGVHRYTESQTVATQRGLPIAPAYGIGDAAYARLMTGSLRLLKRIRRP